MGDIVVDDLPARQLGLAHGAAGPDIADAEQDLAGGADQPELLDQRRLGEQAVAQFRRRHDGRRQQVDAARGEPVGEDRGAELGRELGAAAGGAARDLDDGQTFQAFRKHDRARGGENRAPPGDADHVAGGKLVRQHSCARIAEPVHELAAFQRRYNRRCLDSIALGKGPRQARPRRGVGVDADRDDAALARFLQQLDDGRPRDLQHVGDLVLRELVGVIEPGDPDHHVLEFRRHHRTPVRHFVRRLARRAHEFQLCGGRGHSSRPRDM